MQLKNTVIIITGGASGLGAATAEHLAALGAKVAILDANAAGAQTMAQKLNGLGVVCDVTSEQSVVKALQAVKAKFGPARVCLNFAGILDGGRIVGKDGPMPLE